MFRVSMFGALCLAAVLTPRPAAAADRPTDEQVKRLIDDIGGGYDRWKDGLEKRNLDKAVVTSAARTIDVKKFLDDFKKDIDHLKDRFKSDYAASDEVLAVLRRASDVELRNRRAGAQPSSEWTSLSDKLGALAGAYGVTWPVEDMNVQAARLNDGELASRLEQMQTATGQLKNEADKAAKSDKTIDKAARESLKGSIEQLTGTVKDVRDRVKSDRPASAEAGQVLSQAHALQGTLSKLSLSPAGGTAWSGVQGGCQVIAKAWGIPPPQ